MTNNIKLGDKVCDKITGLVGVATARTEHLNGCIRYAIQPPVDKEGKMQDIWVVDEQQIEVVKEEAFKAKPTKTGGPNVRVPAERG